VSNVIWLFIKPKNLSNVLNAITDPNTAQVCNVISKTTVVLVHGPSSKREIGVETGSGIVPVLRLLHQQWMKLTVMTKVLWNWRKNEKLLVNTVLLLVTTVTVSYTNYLLAHTWLKFNELTKRDKIVIYICLIEDFWWSELI